MRYWQITTRRLSKAATKLEMDGGWHSFASTPNAWYRVWKKKIVQRVNFENNLEEIAYLHAIQELEPLVEMAVVSGFREELNIAAFEEKLYAALPVGYEPPNIEDIQKLLSTWGIRTRTTDGLLYCLLPVETLTRPDLIKAQTNLVALRLFFQAALATSDERSLVAAFQGLRKMLV